MRTFVERVLIIAIGVLIAGCAGTSIKKDAFAKPPKLALVTISGSAHGMLTSDDDDAKILADSVPACLDELGKSSNIRLLPAKAALSAKAYAAIKGDDASSVPLLPGYKRFSSDEEKKNLHALAKELHVDAFVILELEYKRVSGVSVGIGPLSVGSQKPAVDAVISAFTPDGESIWSGRVQTVAEEGSLGVGAFAALPRAGVGTHLMLTDYQKMVSQLKGITQTACRQSVKDLAEQVAAK